MDIRTADSRRWGDDHRQPITTDISLPAFPICFCHNHCLPVVFPPGDVPNRNHHPNTTVLREPNLLHDVPHRIIFPQAPLLLSHNVDDALMHDTTTHHNNDQTTAASQQRWHVTMAAIPSIPTIPTTWYYRRYVKSTTNVDCQRCYVASISTLSWSPRTMVILLLV